MLHAQVQQAENGRWYRCDVCKKKENNIHHMFTEKIEEDSKTDNNI